MNFGLKQDIMTFKDQLIQEKNSLKARLDAVNTLLSVYNNETPSDVINTPSSSVNITKESLPSNFLSQIALVIERCDRFLHNDEITDYLLPFRPNRTKPWLKRRVSSTLSQAKSKGILGNLTSVQYSPSLKDTVWGYSNWLDADGKIIEGHESKRQPFKARL